MQVEWYDSIDGHLTNGELSKHSNLGNLTQVSNTQSRGPSQRLEEIYIKSCKSASMIVAASAHIKHPMAIHSGVEMLITSCSWTPPVKDIQGISKQQADCLHPSTTCTFMAATSTFSKLGYPAIHGQHICPGMHYHHNLQSRSWLVATMAVLTAISCNFASLAPHAVR